jgi:hypothetical protein
VVAPVTLLEAAAVERDTRRWDFVLVMTESELVSHEVPFALGMPARSLGAAVLSTAHLEPMVPEGEDSPYPSDCFISRVERLVLHLLGHLNGLGHVEAETSVMAVSRLTDDLDRMEGYGAEELEALRAALRQVADLRLEEQMDGSRLHPSWFYLTVAWRHGNDIWHNVRVLQPWRFPVRLNKLTIAGATTLLVLLMTAEAWELGMSQPVPVVALFAAVSLGVSSLFVLVRQGLWGKRRSRRMTEQVAVTNLSMLATVVLGMLTMYALLFGGALVFGWLFFHPTLERAWAATVEAPLDLERHLVFSAFVATLGLLVGALGATFEEESYFRHVACVDEET